MYDPKFEKEVQRKMEELEFSPSEAVWTNIERAVNTGRRRRRVPFFWLFFLSGIFLVGAGVIILKTGSHSASPAAGGAVRSGLGTTEKTATERGATVKRETTVGNGTTIENGTAVKKGTGKEIAAESAEVVKRATTIPSGPASDSAGVSERAVGKGAFVDVGMNTRKGTRTGKRGGTKGSLTTEQGATIGTGTVSVGGEETMTGTEMTTGTHPAVKTGATGVRQADARQPFSYLPGLDGLSLTAPDVRAAELTVKKSNQLVKSLPKPHRPWEAAFTGGIGISSLNQFTSHGPAPLSYASAPSSAFSSSYYSLTAPTTGYSGSAAGGKDYQPDLRPDLSFSAGIMARKPLSNRWAVTIGLDLHYYSTSVGVGQQVNGYTPASAALLGAAALAPIQTYPYYFTGADQRYTNRYYFLEIPGSVQWQINHSRVMPLFWEGGVSLSYLMSSDALYYNKNSGVFFKDGSVVNRTQINLSTSLLLGLSLGDLRLQAGPQIQYGAASLLPSSVTGGQHLFYEGIRIVLLPGRK